MGKFEITRRKNGEFQFNLKDADGHVILTSEGYTRKDNCINGIASVKKNCLIDERYERLISSDEKPYFNLKAGNGEVIGTSPMYDTDASREAGIELLKKVAPDAEIIDLTFEEKDDMPEPKKEVKTESHTKVAAATVAAGAAAATSTTASTASTSTTTSASSSKSSLYEKEPENKSSWGWLKFLLPLLALLLIGFFAWKSCNKSNSSCENHEPNAVVEGIVTVETTTPEVQVQKEPVELTLSNGVKLNALKGGIEDQLITFLQSDEYKKATNEELKNKWFRFDNIEFKFNSGTELMDHSKGQLDNIVEIMKCFKDAKFKIGAYTDKIGTEAENMKISQERANTIKSILTKDGFKNQIIGAEGYGEKFATHNESESDTERAHDRIVALRLEK